MFKGHDKLLIAARHGAPLAVGYGDTEMYLGSDAMALAPFTSRLSYLLDGDWAVHHAEGRHHPRWLRCDRAARDAGVAGLGADGRQGQPPPFHGQGNLRAARNHLAHAQPLCGHGRREGGAARKAAVRFRDAAAPDHLGLRHGLLCRAWSPNTGSSAMRGCRSMSMWPPSSVTASRRWTRAALALFISQSGETADTLAALRYCAGQGPACAVAAERRRSPPSAAKARWCSRRCAAPRSVSLRPRR